MVVSGCEGLDELSISGPSLVCELHRGVMRQYEVTPNSLACGAPRSMKWLGASRNKNAQMLRDVLGTPVAGARRDIVALNAGAALVVCEAVKDLQDGVLMAVSILESGKALEKLDQWARYSQWLKTS